MKPELRAMILATENVNPSRTEDDLKAAFLAALHWRGDELWCGPIMFGHVTANYSGPYYRHPIVFRALDALWSQSTTVYKTKQKARAALEAAAREQITKWFEEQSA